ncbi:MAG: chorismate synthase [Muribaculaceae bacterium]|nr:chorismate synthase [Muribaculaceae bacterium]
MNTLGTKLRVTTFGESHGPAIGGVIDGFPSGFKIDFDSLLQEVAKRSPGSSLLVTQRKEPDIPEFLSGINEEGITLGTPIGFIIRNTDNRGKDYSELAEKFRSNHADYTYEAKYGIRDPKGGGRSSARETANWVVAGALAQQWLKEKGVEISSILSGAGKVSYSSVLLQELSEKPFSISDVKIPDKIKDEIENEILNAKNQGDSLGGSITCLITGVKPGIGDPVFDKLHSRLAQAMMSINAAKGFEYGLGIKASTVKGSEVLDTFRYDEIKGIYTETNYSGGIQGGISNGMPIFFNVALKPTPTIMREVETLNKNNGRTTLTMKGRHDPCVAVRAVPVVKALAALVIADFLV